MIKVNIFLVNGLNVAIILNDIDIKIYKILKDDIKVNNRKILIDHMQALVNEKAKEVIFGVLEDHGIEGFSGIQFDPKIRDISRQVWKDNYKFIKLYKAELSKFMKNKDIFTVELLGFITILSNYLGYEDNYLYNSKEEYLTQSELIKITGWSRRKVSNTINLLIDNEILFQFPHENDKRKHKYFMNPKLVYQGRLMDQETKAMFEDEEE